MIAIKNQSVWLEQAIECAFDYAETSRSEFLMPEHLLYCIALQPPFQDAVSESEDLAIALKEYISRYVTPVPKDSEYTEPELSVQLRTIIAQAYHTYETSSATSVDIPQIINAMCELKGSVVQQYLAEVAPSGFGDLMVKMIQSYAPDSVDETEPTDEDIDFEPRPNSISQPSTKGKAEWLQYVLCLNDEVEHHNPLIGRKGRIRPHHSYSQP